MPLAHLIFFTEPRELTEAQIEEARALGHLREDPPPPAPVPAPAPAGQTKET